MFKWRSGLRALTRERGFNLGHTASPLPNPLNLARSLTLTLWSSFRAWKTVYFDRLTPNVEKAKRIHDHLIKIEKNVKSKALLPRNRAESSVLNVTCDAAQSARLASAWGTSSFVTSFAHKFFVSAVLRRVTEAVSGGLRKRAAQQLGSGSAKPFLALIGASLASGTGLIVKQDELDCVCKEIRKAVGKTVASESGASGIFSEVDRGSEMRNLTHFEFGPVIAKGCNAVVHGARMLSPGLKVSGQEKEAESLNQREGSKTVQGSDPQTATDVSKAYPLAIKMMFNYEAESNALAIVNVMHREIVPAQTTSMPDEVAEWSNAICSQKNSLPKHPNIVDVHLAFVDFVPSLADAMKLYPDALPHRLNPDGYGRNMSLFLVMKKYDCNLRQFLARRADAPTYRTSLLLLTQLLEGVAHMVKNRVAHRDLKSDNILLDTDGGKSDGFPKLVASDFGCCLSDPSVGLKLPFSSQHTDRGGNAALMAPEVAKAVPGLFVRIDYLKADVWAVGTIAYEIFGSCNPFQDSRTSRSSKRLSSRTFRSTSELPPMPDHVPSVVRNLVRCLLEPNPIKRLSAETAANICHLLLWAPTSWTRDTSDARYPGAQEMLHWALTMTTKILFESRFAEAKQEHQLVGTFLSRFDVNCVRNCLDWIHSNVGTA